MCHTVSIVASRLPGAFFYLPFVYFLNCSWSCLFVEQRCCGSHCWGDVSNGQHCGISSSWSFFLSPFCVFSELLLELSLCRAAMLWITLLGRCVKRSALWHLVFLELFFISLLCIF